MFGDWYSVFVMTHMTHHVGKEGLHEALFILAESLIKPGMCKEMNSMANDLEALANSIERQPRDCSS